MGKIVVMSDIHFGLKEYNLNIEESDGKDRINKRKKKIDDFFDWLITQQRDIEEVIFIGDIFDLHLNNFAEAVSGSYYFLRGLANLQGLKKITYIPGNHDHTMWLLHILYFDIIKKFEPGVFPKFKGDFNFVYNRFFKEPESPSFLQGIFTGGKGIEFCVTYPILIPEKISNKNFAFFHGHFLDKKQRVTQKIFKILFRKLDLYQLQQFELFCSPQYETFFLLAQCTEGRTGLKNGYDGIIKKTVGDYRKPVHDLNKGIKHHLKETGLQIDNNPAFGELDYIIFGHTHYAGIGHYRFSGNTKLIGMNTGSWERSGDTMGEFMVIDKNMSADEHPQLFIYKWKQPSPILHAQSELLNEGYIPYNKVRD